MRRLSALLPLCRRSFSLRSPAAVAAAAAPAMSRATRSRSSATSTSRKAELDCAARRRRKPELQPQKRKFPKAGTTRVRARSRPDAIAVPGPAAAEYAAEGRRSSASRSPTRTSTRGSRRSRSSTSAGSEKRSTRHAARSSRGSPTKRSQDAIKLQLVSREGLQEGDRRREGHATTTSRTTTTAQHHETHYAQPESRDVRHILVKKKALADKLYAAAQGRRATSPQLAKKYSTDTGSKVNGGKLTGGTKGRTVPAVRQGRVLAQDERRSRKPVHTQFGWHIIQALGADQAGASRRRSRR